LGISNLVGGAIRPAGAGRCSVQVGEFQLQAGEGQVGAKGQAKVMIRPERVRIEPHTSTGENRIPGIVERVVYRGSADQVFIRLPGGESVQALVQNAGGGISHAAGDAVRLHLPADALRVLADTGTAVPESSKETAGSKDLVGA
jgi:ABC-type Fe3+/spermidine/putrescine transport system ATPase subunit